MPNYVEPDEPVFNPGKVVYGKISFDTKVAGNLYIDNNKLGYVQANTQNNELEKITVGQHKIRIGDIKKTIQVNENKTTYIKFDLPTQFTDSRDGKTYKIVYIGNQVWMAENLAYKPSSGNYWAYDNDNSNVTKYGYLYNWETANKVCPSGYHLSTDDEWKELEMHLGMTQTDADYTGGRGTNEGNQLKSETGWETNSGTNESGFNALPGGFRYYYGSFDDVGDFGYWWSSSAESSSSAWSRYLFYGNTNFFRNHKRQDSGFSIRCVGN